MNRDDSTKVQGSVCVDSPAWPWDSLAARRRSVVVYARHSLPRLTLVGTAHSAGLADCPHAPSALASRLRGLASDLLLARAINLKRRTWNVTTASGAGWLTARPALRAAAEWRMKNLQRHRHPLWLAGMRRCLTLRGRRHHQQRWARAPAVSVGRPDMRTEEKVETAAAGAGG